MKKFQGLTTALVIAFVLVTPFTVAHAEIITSEIQIASNQSDAVITSQSPIIVVNTPEQDQLDELASLKIKEKDPTGGFFTKMILRFKIKQLENQITLKKALQ